MFPMPIKIICIYYIVMDGKRPQIHYVFVLVCSGSYNRNIID